MQIGSIVAMGLLMLPVAAGSQEQARSGPGHFEGWPGVNWGADKQTFDVKLNVRGAEALFTVAENGFGWHRPFTGSSNETFVSWRDVEAWCSAPGAVSFRARALPPVFSGIHDVEAEDLVRIVDGYFKKHAAEAEWSSPGWVCSPVALRGTHPAAISRVREMLEAAEDR